MTGSPRRFLNVAHWRPSARAAQSHATSVPARKTPSSILKTCRGRAAPGSQRTSLTDAEGSPPPERTARSPAAPAQLRLPHQLQLRLPARTTRNSSTTTTTTRTATGSPRRFLNVAHWRPPVRAAQSLATAVPARTTRNSRLEMEMTAPGSH